MLNVSKSRIDSKAIYGGLISPKNERWDNFQYMKLSQRSFFGRIEDTRICYLDCLTFSIWLW